MEKIPLSETWKGLKKLEVEARKTVLRHIASLAKRAELEKVINDEIFPPKPIKCLLWPWLRQCHWPPPPPDCYECGGVIIDYRVAGGVIIDGIMQHLPSLEPARITEDAVLKASIAVMEKRISLMKQSLDRVVDTMKKFK